MAKTMNATCSECQTEQAIDLNPRHTEIKCSYCKHSVPMFDEGALRHINTVRGAEQKKSLIAALCFIGAVVTFYMFAMVDSRGPIVEISLDDDEVVTGVITKRADDEIIYIDEESGLDESIKLAESFKKKIDAHMTANPAQSHATAMSFVVQAAITPAEVETSGFAKMLMMIAAGCGIATMVFGYMASQQTVIGEF